LALLAVNPAYSNEFKDFFQYKDRKLSDFIASKSPPKIYRSDDLGADERHLLEDGYDIIGFSSFNGPQADQKNAIKFAKTIHSEIVIVKYRFVETVSGGTQVVMMPVIGGYGGMIGGAHPVSFDRYEQTALFFAKLKPEKISFGFLGLPLTTQQAAAIGSGKGLSIEVIVRGRPAFDAGLLKGDIILTIAGKDVSTSERIRQVRSDFASQTVPVEIIREGKPQTLQIAVPAAPASDAKR